MSITIAARFDGEVLIPDSPLDLQIGQRVVVKVTPLSDADDATAIPRRSFPETQPDLEKKDKS